MKESKFNEVIGYAMTFVWLGFLLFPIAEILNSDVPDSSKFTHLAIIAAFAAVYIWAMLDEHRQPSPFSDELRPRAAILAVLAALIVAVAILVGIPAGVTLLIFLIALVVITLPPWIGYPLGAAVLAIFIVSSFIMYGINSIGLGLISIAVYVSVVGSTYYTRQANREIEVGKREAVVDERERVARDVHDGLGHTLTVISLKSDLAAKLVDLDPERAKAEIAEINGLSRQAIAEVRATVSGLNSRQLSTELAAVQELAGEIGLDVDVSGDPNDVDPQHRILFGWVLREAVTNIVRHARASSVRVDLGENYLRVADNGIGFDARKAAGNGLTGLRQRVEDAGGTLTVASSGGLGGSSGLDSRADTGQRTGTRVEVQL